MSKSRLFNVLGRQAVSARAAKQRISSSSTRGSAMKTIVFVLLLAVAVSACAPAITTAPAATSIPATSVPPSVISANTPAPTALPPTVIPATIMPTTAPTEVPKVAAQQSASFEGLSSGLDDAKQARIRAANAVMGTPNVDVYINGFPVVNGGKTRQNMAEGQFSGWVYVTPGTYTVTLVPHGGTLNQAMFAPVAVNVEAGHRYTVASIGQLKEKTIKSVVFDETALEASIGAEASDAVSIELNNLNGVNGIDEVADGKPLVENIKYGEARAYLAKVGNSNLRSLMTGKPDGVFAYWDNWAAPATSTADIRYGEFPDTVSEMEDSGHTSELNTLDFLTSLTNQHVVGGDGHLLTFNTLLAAIDKAEMGDQFASQGPYLFFAPTDEAFAALPQDQRAALLNNPQALAEQLKAHLVEGYRPSGSLSGATFGTADIELTNLLGKKIKLQDSFINGSIVGGPNFTVGNGNRLFMIYQLLPVK